MTGYKVFNPDFTCLKFQYKEGGIYKVEGKLVMCKNGFHFCEKAQQCFSFYNFDPKNIVCEVEALGDILKDESDNKYCTSEILIKRVLSWDEVLRVANDGINNTGHSNSGYRNSGNSNSGYRNSGNRNSGNSNSGNSNSGKWNSGNWNSGDRNSGYSNSGNRNSGNSNSGYSNSGKWNSGNWNSGDRNSGDSNSGYRNGGAFCTDKNPTLILFDKPTDILILDWEKSKVVQTMDELLELTIWVSSSVMTDEQKLNNPKHETTEGFLKTKTMHEAWADMWGNLNKDRRKLFTDLPNFDADKFKEITGITI